MARVLEQQAIEDALGGAIEILEMPMSPLRLFELLEESSKFQVPGSDERRAEAP